MRTVGRILLWIVTHGAAAFMTALGAAAGAAGTPPSGPEVELHLPREEYRP